jgi:hypothetical protein
MTLSHATITDLYADGTKSNITNWYRTMYLDIAVLPFEGGLQRIYKRDYSGYDGMAKSACHMGPRLEKVAEPIISTAQTA